MRRSLRHAAAAAMVGTALIGLASTQTAAADPLPVFDFADCPTIPAGADPALWRCEELVSTGTAQFGGFDGQLPEMKMTFAEGEMNGEYAQVFGALRAEPTRVPGGLLGTGDRNPLLRLNIRMEYAGFADFHSNGDQMGEQHLRFRVISPLLPTTCTIGSDQDPVVLKPLRTSGPDVISTDPQVLGFTIEDTQFAVPKTHGCGGAAQFVNRRFDLPSPAGTNKVTLNTVVGLKGYARS
jgi:hypothetical protein